MQAEASPFVTLSPGTVIDGRYEVLGCLGRGTVGFVYLCRFLEKRDLLVALKVLAPDDSEEGYNKTLLARFRNEVRTAYRVQHKNVVRAYEFINNDDFVAYSMEYVRGGSLGTLLRQSKQRSLSESARILSEICSGVQAIHEAGIIHRDLKPGNILLTEQQQVKITDFGIARADDSPSLTARGGVVGTITYLCPEYLDKGTASVQSDIYSIGVIGYELITGKNPFGGLGIIKTVQAKMEEDPEEPSIINPNCPPELGQILLRAIQRDRSKSYESAKQMEEELLALDLPREEMPIKVRAPKRQLGFSSFLAARGNQPSSRGLLYASGFLAGTVAAVLMLLIMPPGKAVQELAQHRSAAVRLPKQPIVTEPRPVVVAAAMVTGHTAELGADYELVLSSQSMQEPELNLTKVFTTEFVKELAEAKQTAVKKQRGDDPATMELTGPKAVVEAEPVRPAALVTRNIETIVKPKPRQKEQAPQAKVEPVKVKESEPVPTLEPSKQYKVQATLLYRFADFVKWPTQSAWSSKAPFHICLVGNDPFGRGFDMQLSKLRSGSGRSFSVSRIKDIEAVRKGVCQIAYVNGLTKAEIAAAVPQLNKANVLLVTEDNGLGVIDFVIKDRKVKFTIDRKAADRAGLKLSQLLLDLAYMVKE